MYNITEALGFNAICMIIFLVAIIVAKKHRTAAWLLIAGGAGLQSLSLIGGQKKLQAMENYYSSSPSLLDGLRQQQSMHLIVFLILLALAIILVISRSSSHDS